MSVLRALALTLVLAAIAWSLHRWTLIPLRCARASTRGAAALDAAARRANFLRWRKARGVLATVNGCQCTLQDFHTRAEAAELLGDSRAAIADYERALRIDRRPETYFALGMAHLQMLNRDAAIDNLARACAFDPRRLRHIPDDDVRAETAARVRAAYGDAWLGR